MTGASGATRPGTERERALREVRDLYEAAFPAEESGKFTVHDWNRSAAALEQVAGPDVLDVGVGPGQIFNLLARDPAVDRLVGIDIRWNKKLIRPERGTLQIASIFRLPFPDASFDTVLCMEVLEHLETIEFPKALSEIRRVCRGTLVATVPYQEPEPLWWHDRPGGHRQQFSEEKIDRWFPRAERHYIPRRPGACPWIMLIERFRAAD
jgi:ubiquinone/menaquinone biosynthesis C-methylase UbiE